MKTKEPTRSELRSRMRKELRGMVDYYSEDPEGRRATSGIGCEYLSDSGKMCAVGRRMQKPVLRQLCESSKKAMRLGVNSVAMAFRHQFNKRSGDEMFVPTARGLPGSFWSDLQNLHDVDDFWTATGLSEAGEAKVKEIQGRIDGPSYFHKPFLVGDLFIGQRLEAANA